MSQQENLRIIHEAFEAWNAHDADRYAALLDEGYVEETNTRRTPVRGREGARAAMQEYFRVLPDLHFDLDVMITSGDQGLRRSLRPSQRQQLLGLRMSEIVGATCAFTLVTAR